MFEYGNTVNGSVVADPRYRRRRARDSRTRVFTVRLGICMRRNLGHESAAHPVAGVFGHIDICGGNPGYLGTPSKLIETARTTEGK